MPIYVVLFLTTLVCRSPGSNRDLPFPVVDILPTELPGPVLIKVIDCYVSDNVPTQRKIRTRTPGSNQQPPEYQPGIAVD